MSAPPKRRTGQTSRTKGKHAEQHVARYLRPIFPDVRTKRAGGESATQDRGRDLLGTGPWCVQVKCMAKLQPLVALAEAACASLPTEFPIAFVRQSSRTQHTGWAVVLRAEDFALVALVLERFTLAFPKRLEELRQSLALPDDATTHRET